MGLFASEMVLRTKGIGPWTSVPPAPPRLVSGDALGVLQPDPHVGFVPRPGFFRYAYPGTEREYSVTIDSFSRRITSPREVYGADDGRPEIWIFGCSWTFGSYIGDSQTFPWMLQEKMPRVRIRNYGVASANTLQSLIRFRSELGNKPPPMAIILAHAAFHLERNTHMNSWGRVIEAGGAGTVAAIPRGRMEGDRLAIDTEGYRPWPGVRVSALARYLEDKYHEIRYGPRQQRRVLEAVLRDFQSECDSRGIRFVVADVLDGSGGDACETVGVPFADISAAHLVGDRTAVTEDGHPSEKLNRHFADRLEILVSSLDVDTNSRR